MHHIIILSITILNPSRPIHQGGNGRDPSSTAAHGKLQNVIQCHPYPCGVEIEKRAKNIVVPAVVPFVAPQLSNQIKAMRPTHRDTRHPYLITSRFNISPRKPSTGYSESIAATIQSFGSGDCVESVGVREPLGIIYFLCTRK